jgi:hypothetical protein
LIESNNRLAESQEIANQLKAKEIKLLSKQLQLEQRQFLVEMKKHGIDIKEIDKNA